MTGLAISPEHADTHTHTHTNISISTILQNRQHFTLVKVCNTCLIYMLVDKPKIPWVRIKHVKIEACKHEVVNVSRKRVRRLDSKPTKAAKSNQSELSSVAPSDCCYLLYVICYSVMC